MPTTQDNRLMKITTPLGKDFLLINKLTVKEELSELFEFELELLHEENEAGTEPTVIDVQKILGQQIGVEIIQRDENSRYFSGIVNRFTQGNRDKRFSYFYATVVPDVWLLTQIIQTRIFQHISVPDILKKVFEGFTVKWEITGDFKPRNYCVQYRESDFNFVSRLMEEEGIFYFFEHSDGTHKLIVANTPQSHRDCPVKAEIPFITELTSTDDFIGSINEWLTDYRLQSGKVTLWDYNFQLPANKLDAEQPSRFNIGGNQDLEIYDFHAGYARKYDGIDKTGKTVGDLQNLFTDKQKSAEIMMQALDSQHKTANGIADCSSMAAGFRFKLIHHPTASQNGQYVLTRVEHTCSQSPSYISAQDVNNAYQNSFSCIAHGAGMAPFRPLATTPKPTVRGSQTATVVGAAGEEIFTDIYGRVKVQFQWDRDGKNDADSSCWIRVSQAWAGNKWGMMFIPRIGMEVIVHFIDGDPDQPIITGCVHNPEAMPTYKLPDEKTKMTIKSDTSTGGQGFNELRFEDKKGSEQVFIHGEKDMDVRVKNDEREWVGNDHHFVVKRDRREKIERDEQRIINRDQIEKIDRDLHLKVGGKHAVEITGSKSLKVTGAVAESFGSHSEECSGSLYLKGMNVVIEAMTGLTIKVGGSFVTVNAGGVQISGPMVMINSGGSALSGTAGSLVPPTAPAVADNADDAKPGTKLKLERKSIARKQRTHKEPSPATGNSEDKSDKDSKTSWIEIKLIDEAGKPVAGEAYQMTTPDGKIASGSTNEKGEAKVSGIDPGSCKITFPNLDKDAWEEG